MATIKNLLERITYNPKTGEMFWSKSMSRAGCVRADGYVVVRIDNVLYYRHRLAWMYVYGVEPTYTIDHINGVKGDDRIDNLRDVPTQKNSENRRSASSDSKSGYLGIQRNHSGWQALIMVKGKRKCLGTFKTPEEAHNRYVEAKRQIHEGCTI